MYDEDFLNMHVRSRSVVRGACLLLCPIICKAMQRTSYLGVRAFGSNMLAQQFHGMFRANITNRDSADHSCVLPTLYLFDTAANARHVQLAQIFMRVSNQWSAVGAMSR